MKNRVAVGVVASLWLALHVAGGMGCSRPDAATAPATPTDAPTEQPPLELPQREIWEVITLAGQRVGHGFTRAAYTTVDGQRLLRVEARHYLAVQRFDTATRVRLEASSLQTPDGKLRQFQIQLHQSDTPQVISGEVIGDRLHMELRALGRRQSKQLKWPADAGGLMAVEDSLLLQPLRPGEQRTVKGFDLSAATVVDNQLRAVAQQTTELLGGQQRVLLRVESEVRADAKMLAKMVLWCDERGHVLKTQLEGALRLESYRVPREEALKAIGPAAIDLGIDIAVRPQQPLPEPFASNAHGTHRVQYRVWLKDGSAAEVFRAGLTQQVEAVDQHTARIIVRSVRPGQPIDQSAAADDPPTEADRLPSLFVQSDDELIRLVASRAAGQETQPARLAIALEKYVHQYIKKKEFTRGFATAAEVARTPEGDCTEHAVLLCALLRARGIPARAAIGLIYMQDRQAFGYHMWTEAHIDGLWIPLDAMMGRGGIGAAHLKIDHTSLEGPTAYARFLPVLRIAGQLGIEVEQAE